MEIDFVHFTSVRFRGKPFTEILPMLNEVVEKEYKAKGMIAASPRIFQHNSLSDAIIIENVIVSENSLLQTYPRLYVDPLCGVSVLRGSDIFASGVIGIESGATKDSPVSVFACLDKFNAGFTKAYTGATRFLGNGLLVMERRQLLGDVHAHSGVAVQMTQPLAVCPSFQSHLFQSGLLVAQNLPSLVCARILDARPGDSVLDLCSAPGGKCLHLADIMQMKGTLVAIDKSAKRLQSVTELAVKLGINTDSFLRVHCYDSCRLCNSDGTDAIQPDSKPPYRPGQFDRVLLDAPCSALGQRPRLVSDRRIEGPDSNNASCRLGKTAAQLDSYAQLQRCLFQQAIQLVKPGGFLVYSTCTTRPEENEHQITWALKTHWPSVKLVEQTPNLRPFSIDQPDGSSVMVQKFDSEMPYELSAADACNYDTIGFFVAKFVVESN